MADLVKRLDVFARKLADDLYKVGEILPQCYRRRALEYSRLLIETLDTLHTNLDKKRPGAKDSFRYLAALAKDIAGSVENWNDALKHNNYMWRQLRMLKLETATVLEAAEDVLTLIDQRIVSKAGG